MGEDGVALYISRDQDFNLVVDLRAFCYCALINGMIRHAAMDNVVRGFCCWLIFDGVIRHATNDVVRGFCCWLIFDGVISAGSNGVRMAFVKVFN